MVFVGVDERHFVFRVGAVAVDYFKTVHTVGKQTDMIDITGLPERMRLNDERTAFT